MVWVTVQWLALGILAALMGYGLWRYLARPAVTPAAVPVADPFAGQVAEFARQVGDWSRGR